MHTESTLKVFIYNLLTYILEVFFCIVSLDDDLAPTRHRALSDNDDIVHKCIHASLG